MMFSAGRKPTDAYTQVSLETGVASADPHKLVMMLFDGAVLSLSLAVQAMKDQRIAEKGRAISDAISIISSGLQASLDTTSGGELADRLNALYDYMCERLIFANLRNDPAAISEVIGLLDELRGAWAEIAKDAPAISGNKGGA
jgi:flagellar protein FliS